MRYKLSFVLLCCSMLLTGCLESWFMLDKSCRLPQWFLAEAVEDRENYQIKLAYYIDRGGRSAEFTLMDHRGKKIRHIKTKQYGSHPVFIDNNGFVRKYDRQYPTYELVEYNGVSEVLVHQQKEGNDFCLLDDKIIMKKLKNYWGQ